MQRVMMIIAGCAFLVLLRPPAGAAGEARHLTQQEKDFFASSITPAMMVIKIAMPPVPAGWTVSGETVIDPSASGLSAEDIGNFHFTYLITYERIAGVADEVRKLEEGLAEITYRHTTAADKELAELRTKQEETETAIKKAQKRKEIGRERKLKKQLEEINKRIAAILQERDRKILEETEPLLVRDRSMEIRVTINETAAEYPDLGSYSRPKAAFAFRRDGEREGATGWREAKTVILYGDWQEVKKDVFRAKMEPRPFSPRAQTVRIAMTGDRTRTDQMLKKMDIRSVLELMK